MLISPIPFLLWLLYVSYKNTLSIIHSSASVTVIHNLHIYLRVNISKENVGQDFIFRLYLNFIWLFCWHYFFSAQFQPAFRRFLGAQSLSTAGQWDSALETQEVLSPGIKYCSSSPHKYSSEHLFLYVVNLLEFNEIKWALTTMPMIQVHTQMLFLFCTFLSRFLCNFIHLNWGTRCISPILLCCILFVFLFLFHFDIWLPRYHSLCVSRQATNSQSLIRNDEYEWMNSLLMSGYRLSQ